MQDQLKKFVDDHRNELEVHQPRESLWDGIDERLRQRRSSNFRRTLAIAASVLLLLSCGTYIYFTKQRNTKEVIVQNPSPVTQPEAYYTALLNMKDAELDQYCRPQPDLCKEFENDMAALNSAYRQLKMEYAVSADKKAILKAMTTNLQTQVQLINQQLQIMEMVQEKKEVYKTI